MKIKADSLERWIKLANLTRLNMYRARIANYQFQEWKLGYYNSLRKRLETQEFYTYKFEV